MRAASLSLSTASTAVTTARDPTGYSTRGTTARLSPFVRHRINMLGRYSSQLPDLPGGMRPLRAPDADDAG
ncbi:hypothetical protein ACH4E7_34030 [Kitasatospora sp. NPDC018058]|uniref:hypothetical protein n=1 Tax=Kitasatospora sp. NPDC018058 TaxID=3364025 RepID=UPI0037BED588